MRISSHKNTQFCLLLTLIPKLNCILMSFATQMVLHGFHCKRKTISDRALGKNFVNDKYYYRGLYKGIYQQYSAYHRRFCSIFSEFYLKGGRVRILARILAKCELKKLLARWYFLYLHFLASGNLGLLSVALILDINLLSSFLKCRSFHFYPSEKPCQWQRFTLDTTSMRRHIL